MYGCYGSGICVEVIKEVEQMYMYGLWVICNGVDMLEVGRVGGDV